MGMLRVTCTCGQGFKVPEAAMGEARKCPKCGAANTITDDNAVLVMEESSVSSKLRIGELLVKDGLINEDQLQEALAMQKEKGGKTVQNLIALQHLDASTFVNFLSKMPGLASIEIVNYTIPQEVVSLIPADFVRIHEILPIDKMGKDLTVAMACPLDEVTIHELEELTALRIRPLLVSLNDLKTAIEGYYPEPDADTDQEPESGGEPTIPAENALPFIESSLTLGSIVDLIKNLESLPALP